MIFKVKLVINFCLTNFFLFIIFNFSYKIRNQIYFRENEEGDSEENDPTESDNDIEEDDSEPKTAEMSISK